MTKFECTICCETHYDIPIKVPQTKNGDLVCRSCFLENLRPQFEAALRYEYAWPVRWGRKVLDPNDYAALLPATFLLSWFCKVKEYKTPGDERVYCNHRVQVGSKMGDRRGRKALPAGRASMFNIKTEACGRFFGTKRTGGIHVCFSCGGLTCSGCGAPQFLAGQEAPTFHICQREQGAGQVDYAFANLKKGDAFQICPGCSSRIGLLDGCNQIMCTRCSTSFCYLCGKKVADNDGHFDTGMPCSRYNQPGAKNAVWDIDDRVFYNLHAWPFAEVVEHMTSETLNCLEGLRTIYYRIRSSPHGQDARAWLTVTCKLLVELHRLICLHHSIKYQPPHTLEHLDQYLYRYRLTYADIKDNIIPAMPDEGWQRIPKTTRILNHYLNVHYQLLEEAHGEQTYLLQWDL